MYPERRQGSYSPTKYGTSETGSPRDPNPSGPLPYTGGTDVDVGVSGDILKDGVVGSLSPSGRRKGKWKGRLTLPSLAKTQWRRAAVG